MELGGEQEKAWDQRAGESNLWHKRFSLYLLMGPTRSLQAAYREEYARKHGGATTKKETASNWKTMASRWQWSQRAKAWDQEQLAMAGVALRNKMLALQEQRLDVTAELINRARTVLNNAHLEEADQAAGTGDDRGDADDGPRHGGACSSASIRCCRRTRTTPCTLRPSRRTICGRHSGRWSGRMQRHARQRRSARQRRTATRSQQNRPTGCHPNVRVTSRHQSCSCARGTTIKRCWISRRSRAAGGDGAAVSTGAERHTAQAG